MAIPRSTTLVAAAAAIFLAVGCGKEGPPVPPAPRGPLPAGLVAARQIGDRVVVGLTVPEPRGHDEAQQPVSVEILRVAYPPGLTAPVDPDAFRLRGEVVARVERDPLEPGLRLVVDDSTLAELERATEGWTLRYGVRVRDRRGRPSPLVAAEDLMTVRPPSPPGGVLAEATADGVRLSWAPGEEGVKFNVYRGRDAAAVGEAPLNAQPLSAASYLDADAEIGVRYRYVVRALASEGMPRRESASSLEVDVLAEDRFAPATPSGLVAVQEGSAIRLFWTPNGERDLAGYRLYRRVGQEPWSRIGPDPVVEPFFLDAEPAAGTHVSYRVTAIDRASSVNESAPSDPIDVDVVADPLRQPGTGR